MRARSGASVAVSILAVTCGLSLTACSSGSSTPTTTAPPGTAVLGAPFGVWVRGHPPVSAGGRSGYGSVVAVDNQPVPEFTDVRQLNGKVISFHLSMPDKTKLGPAEVLVRAQLPTDARQTESWRGSFSGAPTAYCEFVNYQSDKLATSIGVHPSVGAVPNIGTSLYQRSGGHSGTASIVEVNQANVSTAANSVGDPC
jgi:hypothetical protein